MNYGQRISNETFRANLELFTEGVANNFYKPIPKEEWRILKALKAQTIVINYIHNQYIWISDEGKHSSQFTINDNSLGLFFYRKYFQSKEMSDNMTYTTTADTVSGSNCMSNTITTGTSYTYTIPSTNIYTTTP